MKPASLWFTPMTLLFDSGFGSITEQQPETEIAYAQIGVNNLVRGGHDLLAARFSAQLLSTLP